MEHTGIFNAPSLELAVLVAGGKSLRMGRDKALLDWEGKPLWRHQLEKLQALSPRSKVVVAAPERPAWLPDSVDWLQDALLGQPGQQRQIGPLGALLAALESAQKGLVATLAVDLPTLTAEYLRSLLSACQPSVGVVPHGPFGYEPLAAIYPATAAKTSRNWAASGRQDLQGLVACLVQEHQVTVHPVPSFEQAYFQNVNTPADLAAAIQQP